MTDHSPLLPACQDRTASGDLPGVDPVRIVLIRPCFATLLARRQGRPEMVKGAAAAAGRGVQRGRVSEQGNLAEMGLKHGCLAGQKEAQIVQAQRGEDGLRIDLPVEWLRQGKLAQAD